VEFLHAQGVAGASVFRGIEGFGGHAKIHKLGGFSWLPDLPIMIEVIDSEEKLAGLLPELRAMIPDGLITLEAIQYQRLGSPAKAAR
jgi:uncharacterized protein